MLWEVWKYFNHGWIARHFIEPSFHFTYYQFDWVRPWPGDGMYLHFSILGLLAVLIMAGLWYRISTTLFFLGFTYVFLLDQARYLNHFYLICLISLLLIFIPAHRAFSLDAWRHPRIRTDTAPAWTLWLLRAQIGVVYFYGGLAKLNQDWMSGESMRMYLSLRTDFPLIGPLFTEGWMIGLFTYSGLLLDLLVVPFLLWRRTRAFAFALAVVFHLLNARLFTIGIFPWFMIAATLLYFSPEWPRRLLGLRPRAEPSKRRRAPSAEPTLGQLQKAGIVLLAAYLTVQLLTSFRHFLYPGDVSWTGEGHRFSWHMKPGVKSGMSQFFATDPVTNKRWEVGPLDHLTPLQLRAIVGSPDMVLQLSHYIAEDLRRQGYGQIEVRARVLTSLNGRLPQALVDPTVDLAAQPRSFLAAPWITPLSHSTPTRVKIR